MKTKTLFHEFTLTTSSFFFEDGERRTPPPKEFAEEVDPVFANVYPEKLIQQIYHTEYDPLIIGYSHENQSAVGPIAKKIAEVRSVQPELLVALEILRPETEQWITDFLKDEREYREQKTIHGKAPSQNRVAQLERYRSELKEGTSSALLLWCLETGIPARSVEHPEAITWIDQDEYDPPLAKRQFSGTRWSDLRPFYTAISRDTHGLAVIAKTRPAIICVGAYHALKYDFLLGRSGRNSFYFCSKQFLKNQFNWDTIRKMWKRSHELHLKYPPQR